jgi:hypothetical protein
MLLRRPKCILGQVVEKTCGQTQVEKETQMRFAPGYVMDQSADWGGL